MESSIMYGAVSVFVRVVDHVTIEWSQHKNSFGVLPEGGDAKGTVLVVCQLTWICA
jgi:hypothetical protein